MEMQNKIDILKYKSLNITDNRCKKLQIKKSINKEEFKFLEQINLTEITTNSRISEEFLLTTQNSSVIKINNFIINFINKNKNRSKYQIFARYKNINISTDIEKSICNDILLSKLIEKFKNDIQNIEFCIKFYKPKNYRNNNDMDIDF